jgi:hypothetical protein
VELVVDDPDSPWLITEEEDVDAGRTEEVEALVMIDLCGVAEANFTLGTSLPTASTATGLAERVVGLATWMTVKVVVEMEPERESGSEMRFELRPEPVSDRELELEPAVEPGVEPVEEPELVPAVEPEPDVVVEVEVASAAVTGQTVVETTSVSVMISVVFSRAGQFVTLEGQAVIVAVRVLRIVEVVN